MIHIVSPSRYKISSKLLKKSVVDMMQKMQIPTENTVNVVFVGKNKMRGISNEYKNEDVALPVLSFTMNQKMDDNTTLLGEVVICYPQAVLLAAERNKRVNDQLLVLIEHGISNLMK